MPLLQDNLTHYLHKFTRLRQGGTKFGPAPHKPVLVLSIIELFDKGAARENILPITPEFVAIFKENFALLVTTGHNPDFFLPFYHLTSEGFWFVKTLPGKELNAFVKSFTILNGLVEYAFLKEDLFTLLQNPENRNILEAVLKLCFGLQLPELRT